MKQGIPATTSTGLNLKVLAGIILVALALIALFDFGIGKMPRQGGEVRELPLIDSDVVVVIAPDVFEELSNNYKTSRTERLYCLTGEQDGNKIRITGIKDEPTIYLTKLGLRSLAEFACQKEDTIGTLHFHLPDERANEILCEPSTTDIYTFGTLAVGGLNHITQAIQCGAEKFMFFDTSIGGNTSFKMESFKWVVG